MQYIVLDMEWNQPWPGSYSAKKVLPSPIRGEIIQIGAVRMTQQQTVEDEFQVLILPKYYKKMNRKVASLTGIKDALLKENGVPFPEAMERFRAWCGEDCTFITWGFDDITVLKENLALWQLDSSWADRWFNAQLIFNAQMGGGNNQKALKTALEMMEITPSRPAHDALGDAYHTALVCQKLRMAEGIADYEAAEKEHENGFHGAELPGCVQRSVHHGFSDKKAALDAMAQPGCPECGAAVTCSRWHAQPGRRYLAQVQCPEHGEWYLRVRLIDEEDGTLRANRLVYSADSEVAQTFRKLEQTPRRAPRRRSRRKKAPAPEQPAAGN